MEPLPSRRKGSSYKGQKHGTESNTFKSQNVVYLQQELEDKDLPQDAILCQAQHNDDTSETLVAGKPEFIPELKGGLITSLNPLRIHCNPSHPPRAPTLPECEVIIRQLYNANSLQSQEILRIKAVLRDIIFNRRITPENYILTKAYLADDKRVEEPERFPKLPGRALPRGKQVAYFTSFFKLKLKSDFEHYTDIFFFPGWIDQCTRPASQRKCSFLASNKASPPTLQSDREEPVLCRTHPFTFVKHILPHRNLSFFYFS
ncbi:uncharacterized protein si:ch211-222n4.2 isoform X2 [Hoplias malabaricus]